MAAHAADDEALAAADVAATLGTENDGLALFLAKLAPLVPYLLAGLALYLAIVWQTQRCVHPAAAGAAPGKRKAH